MSDQPDRRARATSHFEEAEAPPVDEATEKLHKVLAQSGLGSRRDMEDGDQLLRGLQQDRASRGTAKVVAGAEQKAGELAEG